MLSACSHELMSCHENAVNLILVDSVKTGGDPLREAESHDELFASTRWTMVLGAGASATASADALNALSELCHMYCRPLYAFVHNQRYGPADVQEFTQFVVADRIQKPINAPPHRQKGPRRSSLRAA